MVRLMRSWLGDEGPRIVVGAVTVVDEDGDVARAHALAQVQMYLEVVAELDPTLERRGAAAREVRDRRDAGRGRCACSRALRGRRPPSRVRDTARAEHSRRGRAALRSRDSAPALTSPTAAKTRGHIKTRARSCVSVGPEKKAPPPGLFTWAVLKARPARADDSLALRKAGRCRPRAERRPALDCCLGVRRQRRASARKAARSAAR